MNRNQRDSMDRDGNSLQHGGLGERKVFRKLIDDARGNGDKLGKGSGTSVVAARDTQHLAIVAEVHVAAQAMSAGATINGGIESDSVAFLNTIHVLTDSCNNSGRFVSHNNGRNAASGGPVVAVNITSADSAGCDANKNLVRAGRRNRDICEFQAAVFR